ncbi:MAG TPA: hypothetical protein VFP53_07435 [Sphingomicrobium sp.]|nr:hypothetical protein [Sphingomicrobium sp.]
MTDELYSPRPVARWYIFAAFGSVLFMAIGVAGFVMDMMTDPASLPLDRRGLYAARPIWMVVAYGIAVWAGLAGAVLLVMKRKLAVPLLLVSLVAAVVTFLPYAVVPAIRDNITTNDVAAAIVVIAITWTIFWFARHSAQRGWLS